ncbi:TPM domain-containing protein [Suicoccus acidiformans]|nr:TPM domain-containing protein [Suicoccus acidiformans]
MARGGGRGGGAGGRTGGFGGSRGGGGRSSSGGRGGGRPRQSQPQQPSFGGSPYRRSRPVFIPPMMPMYGRRRRRVGPPMGPQRPVSGGGSGCGTWIILLIVLMVISGVFFSSSGYSGNNNSQHETNQITTSTVEREPLPAGAVNETAYYTDAAGWVESRSELEQGLKYFYQKTGVQPHVYIATDLNGSKTRDMADVRDFAEAKYDELFTDEAHVLLLFYEPYESEYKTYYVSGSQAKQVFDDEAGDILLDYIDRNYYNMDLNTSQFFSQSFRQAADRMMEVTQSPWVNVWLVVGVLAIIIVLFIWWRKRAAQQEAEAKRTEEILSRPIETFGSDVSELEKKYQDSEDTQ